MTMSRLAAADSDPCSPSAKKLCGPSLLVLRIPPPPAMTRSRLAAADSDPCSARQSANVGGPWACGHHSTNQARCLGCRLELGCSCLIMRLRAPLPARLGAPAHALRRPHLDSCMAETVQEPQRIHARIGTARSVARPSCRTPFPDGVASRLGGLHPKLQVGREAWARLLTRGLGTPQGQTPRAALLHSDCDPLV